MFNKLLKQRKHPEENEYANKTHTCAHTFSIIQYIQVSQEASYPHTHTPSHTLTHTHPHTPHQY